MDDLGIDVGKATLVCELLQGERSTRKTVPNNIKGFDQLSKWLMNCKAVDVHARMEATGTYGEGAAEYLYDHDPRVSVVNPSQINSFRASVAARTKTDEVDARIITPVLSAMAPHQWKIVPRGVVYE